MSDSKEKTFCHAILFFSDVPLGDYRLGNVTKIELFDTKVITFSAEISDSGGHPEKMIKKGLRGMMEDVENCLGNQRFHARFEYFISVETPLGGRLDLLNLKPGELLRTLIIRDVGPWDVHRTITNDAEGVVRRVRRTFPGVKRLFYFDSEGVLGELVMERGKFSHFGTTEYVVFKYRKEG